MTAFAMFYMIWLNRQQWGFKTFLAIAIIIRLILLFAVPELSNDFYRFIWDGELLTRGINPFAHTPNDLISQGPFYTDQYMRVLYHGMGELSQANYSCYPVLNQTLFYLPASVFESIQANVISLKLLLILADIGVIIIGKKILEFLKLPVHNIWLYALNPFIILEFSGNLHFEGVMIFFLLMAIYLVLLDKWMKAAVFFAMAVQIKLVPLLLLPFFYKKLRWRRSLGFSAMSFLVIIGIGMILINEHFLNNMLESINLYFVSFEFNASIFYLYREYSFATVGWDEIAEVGPFLSRIGTVLIVLLAIVRAVRNDKQIFAGMLFAFMIYYAFSTTVHPWYISMVLVFSIFTKYKFGLIWSLLVMLSYYAYSNPSFTENLLFVTVEYVLVGITLIVEVIRNTKRSNFGLQLKEFFSDKIEDE